MINSASEEKVNQLILAAQNFCREYYEYPSEEYYERFGFLIDFIKTFLAGRNICFVPDREELAEFIADLRKPELSVVHISIESFYPLADALIEKLRETPK